MSISIVRYCATYQVRRDDGTDGTGYYLVASFSTLAAAMRAYPDAWIALTNQAIWRAL